MPLVFVSYARKDAALAGPVVRVLQEKFGQTEVYSDTLLPNSAQFIQELNNHLRASKCILVLWSRHAVDSQWVNSEAYMGFEENKLVMAKIVKCKLLVPFNTLQCADLTKDTYNSETKAWRELFARIESLSSRETGEISQTAPLPGIVEDLDVSRADQHDAELATSQIRSANLFLRRTLKEAGNQCAYMELSKGFADAFGRQGSPRQWMGYPSFLSLCQRGLRISDLLFDPTQFTFSLGDSANSVASPDEIRGFRSFHDRVLQEDFIQPFSIREFRSIFSFLAQGLVEGLSSIVRLTEYVKVELAEHGLSIPGVRISYILKDSFFGGLKTGADVHFYNVGWNYAESVFLKFAGSGWKFNDEEMELFLMMLGCTDVSIASD